MVGRDVSRPLSRRRRTLGGTRHERVEQFVDIVRDHERLDLAGPYETLLDSMADEGEEFVEEAVHVEDAAASCHGSRAAPR